MTEYHDQLASVLFMFVFMYVRMYAFFHHVLIIIIPKILLLRKYCLFVCVGMCSYMNIASASVVL